MVGPGIFRTPSEFALVNVVGDGVVIGGMHMNLQEHAGTLADPIPWVYGMDCYEGKYYSHNGSIYRVATGGTMAPCVWEPGTTGLWQWELVG